MPLRKCKECGNQVSSRAMSCPQCGSPVKKKPGCLANLLAGVLMVVLAGWGIKSCGDAVFAPETPEQAQKTRQVEATRAEKRRQDEATRAQKRQQEELAKAEKRKQAEKSLGETPTQPSRDRVTSASDSAGDAQKPTQAYRHACQLIDQRRPHEAIARLDAENDAYCQALKASLLGDPSNQQWGLADVRVDDAHHLAKSVLPALEARAGDDAEAAFLLGRLYARGIGVPKDSRQAVKFYESAAAKKHALATAALAVHYYGGDGITQDYTEAYKLSQKAARLGSVNAAFNVGLCFDLGHGAKENKTAAEYRFKTAARRGHTAAMCALASREIVRADELFKRKNEAAAKKALEKSRELLLESATAENAKAMYLLGQFYRRGLLGKRDWPTAMEWYAKGARLEHAECKDIIERIENAEVVVVSWSSSADRYGFVHVNGLVLNSTAERLEGVQAVVSFFTDAGTFITTDSAFLEFNPLMPGQTSPFEIIAQHNPQMKSARLEFKFFAGRKIHSFSLELD